MVSSKCLLLSATLLLAAVIFSDAFSSSCGSRYTLLMPSTPSAVSIDTSLHECNHDHNCRDDDDVSSVRSSSSSRRQFAVASATIASLSLSFLGRVSPAVAGYGDSSNMDFPSYIDFLIERNTAVDADSFLYRGADRDVQLRRISDAASRLGQIPGIAAGRKWSQVQGMLTGPLGTLGQTMNQISGDRVDARAAAGRVKADLIAIGQAAAKKSEVGCMEAAAAACKDLEAFAKIAF